MREKIQLSIKGFIIGIANIIPGVSGGTLALTLGIYEKLIQVASHFLKNWKENLKFIIPIGIGVILSLLLCSNLISFSLEKYPIPTIFFFVGLILGGVPLLTNKVKSNLDKPSNLILFLFMFFLVTSFSFLKGGSSNVSFENMNILSYLILFFIGVLSASTMVLPGISGSFLLMLLGYYEPILNLIKELSHFENVLMNGLILIPFGLGIIFGIVFISRIVEYLLKKHEIKTYFAILGFVFSSVISIFFSLSDINFSIINVSVGLLLGIVGFIIAYKLGEK